MKLGDTVWVMEAVAMVQEACPTCSHQQYTLQFMPREAVIRRVTTMEDESLTDGKLVSYCIAWKLEDGKTTDIFLDNYYEHQKLFATLEECEAQIKAEKEKEPCLDEKGNV